MINPVNFYRETEFWAPTRKTGGKELASSPRAMENEFVSFSVNPNGTVSLFDKVSGQEYDNLNYYESTGDVGDYWIYYPPYHNQTFTSLGLPSKVWLEENTDLQATIAVETVMELPSYGYRPEKYIHGESRRGDETDKVTIITRYTLKKAERMVHVACDVDNTVEDHRLSVVFDTDVKTDIAHAQGHFCKDERPAIPLRDEQNEYYPELCPQPMQDYVYVKEENRGLAIIQNSMCEYELRQNTETSLSLTLLRAVRNIICTEYRSAAEFPHQKGGQSQRKLVYEYAICPLGDEGTDYVESISRKFCQPIELVQTCRSLGGGGTLPSSLSFIKLDGALQMSALKKTENRNTAVIRVYNPTDGQAVGTLELHSLVKTAWELSLDEKRLKEIAHDVHTMKLSVKPHGIMTVELEFKE